MHESKHFSDYDKIYKPSLAERAKFKKIQKRCVKEFMEVNEALKGDVDVIKTYYKGFTSSRPHGWDVVIISDGTNDRYIYLDTIKTWENDGKLIFINSADRINYRYEPETPLSSLHGVVLTNLKTWKEFTI